MSRLPPPNWDRRPFNHGRFIGGHQIPTDLFCATSLRSPHFMPAPPRQNFCSPPQYDPHMMHNGFSPRPTWRPPGHFDMVHEKTAATVSPDTPEDISKWREQRKRNYPTVANVAKKQGQQLHEKLAVQIKLDTPEEIAKWREERKRNYPTVANVRKKEEKAGERQVSGQVLETTKYRYRNRRGGGFHRSSRRWKNNRHGPLSNQSTVNMDKSATTSTGEKGTADSDPLSLLLASEGSPDNSDSETMYPVWTQTPDGLSSSSATEPAASPTSALASLCAYGDMSSDEDHSGKEDAIEKNNTQAEREEVKQPSKPEKFEPKAEINKRNGPAKGRRPQRKKGKHLARTQNNRRPTLLQMLLAPEVRHERNVILQCLRYIVKRNFFGVDE